MNSPLISLCMPTNGIIDWVFPVLESIYHQGINTELFEIIIADNGDNISFKNKIKEYLKAHRNIIYIETQALPFMNEIESYKKASGEMIKFINHRTKLKDRTLQKFIDYVNQNINSKPITYYSNGVLDISKDIHEYTTFDEFVKNLSYWSSWSSGMAIWKSDLDKLMKDNINFNELFPHTDILFSERHRHKYVIDNSLIFEEIPQRDKPKGNYDLFFAFGVEYPSIILDLLRSKSISLETYKRIVNENQSFVASLYYKYIYKKDYCSYDIKGLKNMYGVFYDEKSIKRKILIMKIKRIMMKVTKI